MERAGEKRIFHDVGGMRKRYIPPATFAFSLVAFCVFAITASSLFTAPSLPSLSLGLPETQERNGNILPASGNPSSQAFLWRSALAVPVASSLPVSQAEVLGFYVNWDDNSLASLKANNIHLDGLIPEWLHLANDRVGIVEDDPRRTEEALEFLRQENASLSVYPLINNYDPRTQNWETAPLVRALAAPDARQALIRDLLKYTQRHHFQGVTVDFEAVPEASQANLLAFMTELSSEFHQHGLRVMQCIPLQDDSFNASAFGGVSDKLILMAYDEHVPGEVAGPVASMDWYTRGVANRFQSLPREKYIVALGGYGYDWPVNASDTEVTTLTFEAAMRKAQKAGANVSLDTASLNPTFSYRDEKKVDHKVWLLDAVSAFNQVAAAQKLGGASGYALWRLGSEDPSFWKIFENSEVLDKNSAEGLQALHFGYDLSYEGRGEILQVLETPREGARSIQYDEASGLILQEQIIEFPTPFVLQRWGGQNTKKIALTFDDGPDPEYTPQILKILDQYQVSATFFILGLNASLHPEIVKDIVRQGSEIGNHTYTHPDITSISQEQFRLELDSTERVIEGVLGRKALLFRPPYAEDSEPANPEEVAPLLLTRDLGYYTVGMHIDPKDWQGRKAEDIAQKVIAQVKAGRGNIVLLHDAGGNREETVKALPLIIEGLRADGFEMVAVSGLMGLSRASVMPPVTAKERFVSNINGLTFQFIGFFSTLMGKLFLVGIFLGIGRFVLLGALGLTNALRVSFLKRTLRGREKTFRPSVSVIVPAYNEEKVIVKTVHTLLASDYPVESIIIVNDGSTDTTQSLLEHHFGKNQGVRILSQAQSGKGNALNYGIQNTTSDIVITLDADTLFRASTVRKLVRNFFHQKVAGVAGNAKVGNRINLLTRWQALEYITSQNLDRRAFELLNCISVIPGSVGAWRRSALLEVGGFSGDTLAEDADMTWTLLRAGYQIRYEEEAIAFTEAPATVKSFLQQRFRWMFGTFQTAWKHKSALISGPPQIGLISVPNVFIFQILFPIISPFMDLLFIGSLLWLGWQKWQHPLSFSGSPDAYQVLNYYLLFLAVDFFTSLIPFLWEKQERLSLLWWLPFQRFFYRQLLYYVALKALWTAIKGTLASWGKQERKATAQILTTEFSPKRKSSLKSFAGKIGRAFGILRRKEV